MNGVGRVRRDSFVLYVGDRQIDVDELRVHYPRAKIEPLVRDLAGGPTPAEAAWLMWFCCGGEYGGLDVVRMLNSPPFARRVEALLDTGEKPAVLRLGETVLRPLMEGVVALGGRNLTDMRFVVDPIVTEHGVPTGSNNVYLEVTTEGRVDTPVVVPVHPPCAVCGAKSLYSQNCLQTDGSRRFEYFCEGHSPIGAAKF